MYIPKLHGVSLGEDTLNSPSCKLAGVVLHFGGQNGTPLAGQLGPPVESTTRALCLVVKLVQRLDGQVLVLAVDVVLNDSIELCSDNKVNRLVILLQRKIEAAVSVGLGRRRISLDFLVVEGVLVSHVDLVGV
jgi:hypothetical protein